MEILEKKVWWVFECSNCGSKLKAEPDDVLRGSFGGNAWEDGERKYYVACLHCGEYKFVPENKLTDKIRDSAAAKSSLDDR